MTEYRNTLKAFYGALKSMDAYLRFALLTGVTKFSKISVFSDLNNLEDISLQQAYNNLCGITEQELLENAGITSKNGRNDAKRLNINVVTVTNDDKMKKRKTQ